jgi:hypothetical protein
VLKLTVSGFYGPRLHRLLMVERCSFLQCTCLRVMSLVDDSGFQPGRCRFPVPGLSPEVAGSSPVATVFGSTCKAAAGIAITDGGEATGSSTRLRCGTGSPRTRCARRSRVPVERGDEALRRDDAVALFDPVT